MKRMLVRGQTGRKSVQTARRVDDAPKIAALRVSMRSNGRASPTALRLPMPPRRARSTRRGDRPHAGDPTVMPDVLASTRMGRGQRASRVGRPRLPEATLRASAGARRLQCLAARKRGRQQSGKRGRIAAVIGSHHDLRGRQMICAIVFLALFWASVSASSDPGVCGRHFADASGLEDRTKVLSEPKACILSDDPETFDSLMDSRS